MAVSDLSVYNRPDHQPRRRVSRWIAYLIIPLVVIVTSAISDWTSPSADERRDAVLTVINGVSTALKQGDADALYALLSQSARERYTRESLAALLAADPARYADIEDVQLGDISLRMNQVRSLFNRRYSVTLDYIGTARYRDGDRGILTFHAVTEDNRLVIDTFAIEVSPERAARSR